jgi:hypothetical protein
VNPPVNEEEVEVEGNEEKGIGPLDKNEGGRLLGDPNGEGDLEPGGEVDNCLAGPLPSLVEKAEVGAEAGIRSGREGA